jgi:hypothetical protein|tara:strand:+ start:460 stop:636 length:177 start_codon:yes stop_codon:yes gene_type:complete
MSTSFSRKFFTAGKRIWLLAPELYEFKSKPLIHSERGSGNELLDARIWEAVPAGLIVQ